MAGWKTNQTRLLLVFFFCWTARGCARPSPSSQDAIVPQRKKATSTLTASQDTIAARTKNDSIASCSAAEKEILEVIIELSSHSVQSERITKKGMQSCFLAVRLCLGFGFNPHGPSAFGPLMVESRSVDENSILEIREFIQKFEKFCSVYYREQGWSIFSEIFPPAVVVRDIHFEGKDSATVLLQLNEEDAASTHKIFFEKLDDGQWAFDGFLFPGTEGDGEEEGNGEGPVITEKVLLRRLDDGQWVFGEEENGDSSN